MKKDLAHRSDEKLVELLKNGDHGAFTTIYERYTPLLFNFTYKRLGDREESRDLVHELFCTLWEKRELLKDMTELGPYLYTIARNRILDKIAHQKIEQRHVDSFRNYVYSGHSTTDELIRHRQLAELIELEVQLLPEKMRQVYELSRKMNMGRKEIAEELGLSEQTVKSHLHHALKHLKLRFGKLFVLFFLFI